MQQFSFSLSLLKKATVFFANRSKYIWMIKSTGRILKIALKSISDCLYPLNWFKLYTKFLDKLIKSLSVLHLEIV